MKAKHFIALISVLCLICVGTLFLLSAKDRGQIVEIYQNKQLLYTIDLEQVDTPYDIELEHNGQTNTIHVIHGDICVTCASCPDGVCVNRGYLSKQITPIVCLPNQVVIQYSSSSSDEVDAVAGTVQ